MLGTLTQKHFYQAGQQQTPKTLIYLFKLAKAALQNLTDTPNKDISTTYDQLDSQLFIPGTRCSAARSFIPTTIFVKVEQNYRLTGRLPGVVSFLATS
jgi:hypothetical protein